MITYKRTGCWPDDENPTEIYIYIYRDKKPLDQIVITEKKIIFDIDISIIAFEMLQLRNMIEQIWQIKTTQDKKGWGRR